MSYPANGIEPENAVGMVAAIGHILLSFSQELGECPYNPVLFVGYPRDIAFCNILAAYPLKEAIEIS